MKRFFVIMAVLVAVTMVCAGVAMAGIANSKHDLTSTSTAVVKATASTISSCQFCHTPHLRTYLSITGAPLWNKDLPSATYTVYGAGSTIAGTAVAQPGANSLICLSCHDGSLSVGAVRIGTTQIIGAVADRVTAAGLLINDLLPATPDYNLTQDLSNEHPVGVVYTTGTAGLAIVAGTGTNPLIVTANTAKRWQIYGGVSGVGKVECASCHDPHNTTAGQTPFLKGTSSSICTDCHASK